MFTVLDALLAQNVLMCGIGLMALVMLIKG
jgi:hypothetical protein